MTVQELRNKLTMIEPSEDMYAGITPQDVSALEQLMADPEDWIAARAVFALSRVGGANAVGVMARATSDQRSPVRVAVAAAIAQRPISLPDEALGKLLQDADPGVRKFATHAVKPENGPAAKALLTKLTTDVNPTVREHAVDVLGKLQ